MDGNNQNHSYLPEDVSYDDLMNNAGWPGPGGQYTYPPPQPAQGQYPQYPTQNQPSYNHQYNLPQQSPYAQSDYSNSPYAVAEQHQQHARPSDGFESAYSVDPSLPIYLGQQGSYSFNPQELSTISPHSLQYGVPNNQGVANHQVNHSIPPNVAYQHSVNYNQVPQDQSEVFNNTQSSSAPGTAQPLQYYNAPNTLPNYDLKQPAEKNFEIVIPARKPSPPVQVKPQPVQDPLRITHPELLAAQSKSPRPPLEHAPYIVWDDTSIQVPPSLKSQYHSLIIDYQVDLLREPSRLDDIHSHFSQIQFQNTILAKQEVEESLF